MKKSILTQRTIKDSAIKLLQSKSSFTFKEIAEDCGVNIASVNYHFGSKETLINEIIKEKTEELTAIIEKALPTISVELSAGEVAKLILNDLNDFLESNVGIIKFLFNTNNSEFLTKYAVEYIQLFSPSSSFSQMIIAKLSEYSETKDPLRLSIKYTIALASLSFPLLVNLNFFNIAPNDMPLTQQEFSKHFKDMYLDEIMRILKND